MALLWLLVVLFPAYLFLLIKSRGKQQFVIRLCGGAGFYCLLAGLISEQSHLAYPGIALLVVSVVLNRWSSLNGTSKSK